MAEIGGIVIGEIGKQYAYKDNDSSILFVAHLDTVQQCNHFQEINVSGDNLIFNAKLDDRLGVYTILDLLPKLGITADILFTENEEIGQTTAEQFKTDKKYNWIVEFDRTGADAVCYCYDFDKELKPYFTIGRGTFSDISVLESLGCKGFNIGIGYYNEHSQRAYMDVSEYIEQMARFIRFFNDHKNIHYKHEAVKYNELDWHNCRIYDNSEYYESEEQPTHHCDMCDIELYEEEVIELPELPDRPVCGYCFNEVIEISDIIED